MGVGFIITNCIYHLFFLYIPSMTWLFPLKFILGTSGLSLSHFHWRAACFFCLQVPFKYDLTHLNFIYLILIQISREIKVLSSWNSIFFCVFVCTAGPGYSHVPGCWGLGVYTVRLCWLSYLFYTNFGFCLSKGLFLCFLGYIQQ